MPNHFHFLIFADNRAISNKKVGRLEKNVLSEGIRNVLHTYTKGVNKQNNWTGSLFQQNTKSRIVSNYKQICFHYIHQNPMKAKLVGKMEDWRYSSFLDFLGLRNGTLCNIKAAFEILGINPQTFYSDSYQIIDNHDIQEIF